MVDNWLLNEICNDSCNNSLIQSVFIYSHPNKDTEITPLKSQRRLKRENSIIQFSIPPFKEDTQPSAKQITSLQKKQWNTTFVFWWHTHFKPAFLSNFSWYGELLNVNDEGRISV